jgi:hypothetical protein
MTTIPATDYTRALKVLLRCQDGDRFAVGSCYDTVYVYDTHAPADAAPVYTVSASLRYGRGSARDAALRLREELHEAIQKYLHPPKRFVTTGKCHRMGRGGRTL